MAASFGKSLAGCAFCACIGVSPTHAAAGRIAFSGAVVESTCTTESTHAIAPANGAAQAERRSCGRTATDAGPSYSRVVSRLDTANLAHDPLLAYFASYSQPAGSGAVAAKVIVQTYD